MNALLNNISFFALTFFAVSAHAQQMSSSIELTCRSKAKEVAAEAYRGCVTEARQGQIEQIRSEYQKKLAELKSHYDGELKKVNGKTPTPAKDPVMGPAPTKEKAAAPMPPASASTGSKPKPTKGVAKALPTRKEVKTPAPPVVQVVPENKAVVTSEPIPMPEEPTIPAVTEPTSDSSSDVQIQLVPAPETARTSDASDAMN